MKICIAIQEDNGMQSRIASYFEGASYYLVGDPQSMVYTIYDFEKYFPVGDNTPIEVLKSMNIGAVICSQLKNGVAEQLQKSGISLFQADSDVACEAIEHFVKGCLQPYSAKIA